MTGSLNERDRNGWNHARDGRCHPFIGRPALALLLASLIAASLGQAATTVYRTVDADGQVVYSDVPPASGVDADVIEIQTPETFDSASRTDGGQLPPGDPAESPLEQPFEYDAIAVVAPADDEAIRENSGNVSISVIVTPSLYPEDQIEVLLDGSVAAVGASEQIPLANVDRGTHTVVARVVDPDGRVLLVSRQSTFHLLRQAIPLAPQRPQPRPQPQR